MKTMTVDEFRSHLSGPLSEAPEDNVVVTREGKPWAVFKPFVENDDDSDDYANDPAFWRMIDERRREPTIPWDEAMQRIGLSKVSETD